MAEHRRPTNWDQRYRDGNLPWDTKLPAEALIACIGELRLTGAALEIGCGTGTNALWLARQGFETVGLDVSPTATAQAQLKAEQAGVANVRFVSGDIFGPLPIPAGSVELVFDRGCFHSVAAEARRPFADRVAEALAPEGYWLTLCGNADAPERTGPPQLSAADIVTAVEPAFEIRHLKRIYFNDATGRTHLAWSCLMRKRAAAVT